MIVYGDRVNGLFVFIRSIYAHSNTTDISIQINVDKEKRTHFLALGEFNQTPNIEMNDKNDNTVKCNVISCVIILRDIYFLRLVSPCV